jgi:hypothetical protein
MAETARLAWLEGRSPGLGNLRFDIGFGATRLGRGSSCPVVIADPMVSREHAEIRCEGDTFTITDLGSTHGTFVNRQQVQQAPLSNGSVIRVGNSEFTFHLSQDAVPTAMIGPGGYPAVAAQPGAPRVSTPSGAAGPPAAPPVAQAAPATPAPARKAGRNRLLIGCAVIALLALCACLAVVAISTIGGGSGGILGVFNEALERASQDYTTEDLALALAMPTEDQRPEILANFGPPDEFEISIVQVEGGQVRREVWRYYGYGTRIDFVDGEVVWTIDLDPGSTQAVFPAWYDPTTFETGMTINEARDVLIAGSPASFAPEEIDLTEGGEDLAGGVMLVGDQIMLAFDQGVLVYAETFGVALEETAQ